MPAVTRSPEQLATSLGWFSLALGVPQVLSPGAVARLAGVVPTRGTRKVLRLVGVRELTAAAGLLGQPRSAGWLWARVAGDAKDLALLGVALARGDNRRGRVVAVTAVVAGFTALDVVAAARLSRSGGRSADGAIRATSTITVNTPPEEAYRRWRDLESLPGFMAHLRSVDVDGGGRSHWVAAGPAGTTVEWDAELVEDVPNRRIAWRSVAGADVENSGSVTFTPAPGGQGTEVTVDVAYSPPGGAVGSVVATLFGEEPEQQLRDDLRRFKQVLETGEIAVSDGTPDGSRAQRQLKQRDAQPLGGG